MAETKSEGFVSDNLIPTADGDFLRWKRGNKKGQYITLAEFSALSRSRQIGMVRVIDPAVIERFRETGKQTTASAEWREKKKLGMEKASKDPDWLAAHETANRKKACKLIEGELSSDWLRNRLPELEADPLWATKPAVVIFNRLKLHTSDLSDSSLRSIAYNFVGYYKR